MRLFQASPRARAYAVLLPVAALIGVIVGVVVAGMRYLTSDVLWPRIYSSNNGFVLFFLPAAGVLISGVLLALFADAPKVHDAEAYLQAFHDGRSRERLRSFAAKVAAALATVGLGAAAGLEGPSLHVGSFVGSRIADRLRGSQLSEDHLKSLLVAGAAAGISAVFKAPLTGLIFALEMPYTDDFVREALIPAMISSVSSYLVAISILGAEPLFAVNRAYVPSVNNILLAIALGAVVGVAARLFLGSLRFAEKFCDGMHVPLVLRAAAGGLLCAGFGLLSWRLLGAPNAIGSGYQLIDAEAAGKYLGVVALVLFVLRGGAVVSTLASGAAGGSFVPLVSLGSVVGGAFAALAPGTGPLFPIAGMAAFLAAGNATPIAGAVFVAEATGASGFVIPGLVAAAAAYVVSGGRTLSPHQRPSRRGPQ
jgi:CIC family chloride channel protein